ncbi:MAG: hypothetical protein GX771_06540 [Halomonadaceae bacterium]|nr:hypothetical protein [Halomonadaceae bacterium]
MEITKFDNFAICSDTVEASHGDFTVIVLLDRDPDITPDHADCYCDKTRQRWRDDKWFFGLLRAKVSVDVAGQTVVLDDCAASLGGVEVNITDTNSHLDEYAAKLAQEALTRGIQLVQAIKAAA